MRNSFAHFFVFSFLVLLAATANAETAHDSAAARQLFELVNRERTKVARPPLAWDDRLADAALQHATLMADNRMLSHQFSGEPSLRLRLAKTTIRLDRSGENVAYDTDVEQSHVGLMHSPPHRANILSSDFNAIGIAVVNRGEYVYVVEDFAHRLPEMTALQVESEVASHFNDLRRNAGQPAVRLTQVSRLRSAACAMANKDEVNARAIDVPAARQIVSFTMSDPSQLPSNLHRLAANPEVGSFAVGICFQRTATYPSGVYWGVMAFFPKTDVRSGSR